MTDVRSTGDPIAAIQALQTQVNALSAALNARSGRRPTGDIEPTLLATPKQYTAFCYGNTVLRSAYPDLFLWASSNGLIGSLPGAVFGPGDGSTTFVLPDFRGVVLRGVGISGAVGERTGADAIELTLAQLPTHDHGAAATAAGNHLGHFPGAGVGVGGGTSAYGFALGSLGAGSGDHTHLIPAQGGGGPVDTRQAGVGVNVLIWI